MVCYYWFNYKSSSDLYRKKLSKTVFSIASAEYIWLNDVGYRPGVLSWNPIEINLTDGENTKLNNTKILYDMLKQSGYQTEYTQKPKSAIEKQSPDERWVKL